MSEESQNLADFQNNPLEAAAVPNELLETDQPHDDSHRIIDEYDQMLAAMPPQPEATGSSTPIAVADMPPLDNGPTHHVNDDIGQIEKASDAELRNAIGTTEDGASFPEASIQYAADNISLEADEGMDRGFDLAVANLTEQAGPVAIAPQKAAPTIETPVVKVDSERLPLIADAPTETIATPDAVQTKPNLVTMTKVRNPAAQPQDHVIAAQTAVKEALADAVPATQPEDAIDLKALQFSDASNRLNQPGIVGKLPEGGSPEPELATLGLGHFDVDGYPLQRGTPRDNRFSPSRINLTHGPDGRLVPAAEQPAASTQEFSLADLNEARSKTDLPTQVIPKPLVKTDTVPLPLADLPVERRMANTKELAELGYRPDGQRTVPHLATETIPAQLQPTGLRGLVNRAARAINGLRPTPALQTKYIGRHRAA